jgi:hypothetical protein
MLQNAYGLKQTIEMKYEMKKQADFLSFDKVYWDIRCQANSTGLLLAEEELRMTKGGLPIAVIMDCRI